MYGECITGILGCSCTAAIQQKVIQEERPCDHCHKELRAGMPDGREFAWVHQNGMGHCYLPAADSKDPVPMATFNGTTGLRYA
jgi:hypothetical protein